MLNLADFGKNMKSTSRKIFTDVQYYKICKRWNEKNVNDLINLP